MAEGEKLAEENRLGEATRKFEQILNIDPENEEAQSSLQWLGVGDNGAAMLRVINGKIVGDVISHFLIREKGGRRYAEADGCPEVPHPRPCARPDGEEAIPEGSTSGLRS
jgi:hypothetical protein